TYDPRQVFVQQLPSKNRVILTCRNTDFDDLKLQLPLTGAITLQPLDERAGHVAPRWSNYGTIVEIL
ncbi:MAG: hypothetical protein HY862_11430, partial [Chloroflexi bacterium]|nr:hypothetical protein [Chloroflexota bacterium]